VTSAFVAYWKAVAPEAGANTHSLEALIEAVRVLDGDLND